MSKKPSKNISLPKHKQDNKLFYSALITIVAVFALLLLQNNRGGDNSLYSSRNVAPALLERGEFVGAVTYSSGGKICTDTDNGNNISRRGTAYYSIRNPTTGQMTSFTYIDTCTTNRELREVYCEPTYAVPLFKTITCTNSCSMGACSPSPPPAVCPQIDLFTPCNGQLVPQPPGPDGCPRPPICQPSQCSNECSTNGARQCAGLGYKTCGNYDSDTCLEWSQTTTCSYGCQNGQCTQPNIPSTNQPPRVTSISPPSAYIGRPVTFTANASDPNGNLPLQYRWKKSKMENGQFTYTAWTGWMNSPTFGGYTYGESDRTAPSAKIRVQAKDSLGALSPEFEIVLQRMWCGDQTCQSQFETLQICSKDCRAK